jgi:GTPase SAR1 family protein
MPLQQIPDSDSALVQLIVRPIRDSVWSQLDLKRERVNARFRDALYLRKYLKKDLSLNVAELVDIKCASRLFHTSYRVAAFTTPDSKLSAHDEKMARDRISSHVKTVADAIKAFGLIDYNRFTTGPLESGESVIRKIQQRRFNKRFRLSARELVTLYHPPTLGDLAATAQVLSKKAPPPPDLPTTRKDNHVGDFAHSNYRDQEVSFGLQRTDRRRHLYILGKSGTGKSCLLQLLIRDDMEKGYGCAVLDPHGDLIDDLIRLIPKHRRDDVVIFDPSNPNFAPRFNPMAPVRPELKLRVAMSFIDSFKRTFGNDWSEGMDHVLRYAILGLLTIPGCNLSSLRRMLSDDRFRGEVVRQARDESVKRFWLREFTARRKEFEEGPISRLLNRLDELLATETMREILGQPDNMFNFREFMDNRKIVLLKISKGILGSENASLLGSMLVWKIYEAAMSRADIPAENRQDFYFYVDEFQNFATDSFGEILSEARKYNLSLTFANQYLNQLPPQIRKTIFGNVANFLSFRIGAEDAASVAAEFSPVFSDGDLVNLAIRDFYLKMSINGQVQPPFSGRTLDLVYPSESKESADAAIEEAFRKYCSPIGDVSRKRSVS